MCNYNIIYLNDHFIIHKWAKIMNIKWSAEDKKFIKDSAAELKDNDLVDLLQYCDLVNELETANGKN